MCDVQWLKVMKFKLSMLSMHSVDGIATIVAIWKPMLFLITIAMTFPFQYNRFDPGRV
jgi:hypothetical protein